MVARERAHPPGSDAPRGPLQHVRFDYCTYLRTARLMPRDAVEPPEASRTAGADDVTDKMPADRSLALTVAAVHHEAIRGARSLSDPAPVAQCSEQVGGVLRRSLLTPAATTPPFIRYPLERFTCQIQSGPAPPPELRTGERVCSRRPVDARCRRRKSAAFCRSRAAIGSAPALVLARVD
jgi:hypothetical protein